MPETQGYTGKLLRVDLSTGRMKDEAVDPVTMRKYVGGTGLGAGIGVRSCNPTFSVGR
jgi:aldehyde:ferredoxin oxidoreductase